MRSILYLDASSNEKESCATESVEESRSNSLFLPKIRFEVTVEFHDLAATLHFCCFRVDVFGAFYLFQQFHVRMGKAWLLSSAYIRVYKQNLRLRNGRHAVDSCPMRISSHDK